VVPNKLNSRSLLQQILPQLLGSQSDLLAMCEYGTPPGLVSEQQLLDLAAAINLLLCDQLKFGCDQLDLVVSSGILKGN